MGKKRQSGRTKGNASVNYHIKALSLASSGMNRIEWAKKEMPVLSLIEERFEREKPLRGLRISACLHVTTETANLVLALRKGGAEVSLCASNPLSTQDDVAAALVGMGVSVFAIKGEDRKTYYDHIMRCLEGRPHITMDDGADLVSTLHTTRRDLIKEVLGGTEETTTGVIRLRAMAEKGKLMYPIIAVNDALTKYLFDNRYGTGQSTVDGILRATNILIAGKKFVVCGYGWCGRGIAMRAKGMGAHVIVCEVNPLRALEAVMDGFDVRPLREAAKVGDIFCTATGDIHVLKGEHYNLMKDGAILVNAGHFNVEIDIPTLEKISKKRREIRRFVEEFTLKNGKRIYLLAEGRLVNLSAAEGHPSAVMDMSFANQALCVEYIAKNHSTLERKVYPVPEHIDRMVSNLKLKSLGVRIDKLTKEQKRYLLSWEFGT